MPRAEVSPLPYMTGFAPQQTGAYMTAVSLTTINTWTDFGTGTALSFTKYGPAAASTSGTNIHVRMIWSYFCNSTSTVADMGVAIAGSPYLLSTFIFSTASVHYRQCGEAIIPALGPGTWTIQPRWRTNTTGLRTDTSDFYTMTVTEVPAAPQFG